MIKAIFLEPSEEYGHPFTIGNVELETDDIEAAETEAQTYADTLTKVRGKKINYNLEQNGAIIVKLTRKG